MKIKVLSITDRPEGGADLEIDFDDEAVELVCHTMGVDDLTEEVATAFVIKALEEYLDAAEREGASHDIAT